MNWAILAVAAIPGGIAVALHAGHKAPRLAAILGGLALVFVIAGVPFLLSQVTGRTLGGGPILVAALVMFFAGLGFIWLDIVKGHHAKPLFGKSGKAHHFRPQYATAAVAIGVLMIAANWSQVTSTVGSGFGQTWSSVTTHKGV